MNPAPLNDGLFNGALGKIISPAWRKWFADLAGYLAISSGVATVTATAPVASTGGTNPVISMPVSTDLASGYLSATDHQQLPSAAEKAALAGTGTPSGLNRYATADHDHIAGDGALITEGAISLVNVVTNDVSITKHGFAPIAPNVATQYLNGVGAWSTPPTTAPGGADTQVQFNDSGVFGGSAKFVFNKTTGDVTVDGKVFAKNIPTALIYLGL